MHTPNGTKDVILTPIDMDQNKKKKGPIDRILDDYDDEDENEFDSFVQR